MLLSRVAAWVQEGKGEKWKRKTVNGEKKSCYGPQVGTLLSPSLLYRLHRVCVYLRIIGCVRPIHAHPTDTDSPFTSYRFTDKRFSSFFFFVSVSVGAINVIRAHILLRLRRVSVSLFPFFLILSNPLLCLLNSISGWSQSGVHTQPLHLPTLPRLKNWEITQYSKTRPIYTPRGVQPVVGRLKISHSINAIALDCCRCGAPVVTELINSFLSRLGRIFDKPPSKRWRHNWMQYFVLFAIVQYLGALRTIGGKRIVKKKKKKKKGVM